ncbi:ribonuclease HII [Alkalibacterium psychrotolerans]
MKNQDTAIQKTQTIKDIKSLLNSEDTLSKAVLDQLSQDERKGVQAALKSWHNRQKKRQLQEEKFQQMMQYENQARTAGYEYIAGIDEVGRGPLAGPVVTAAVILPEGIQLQGINDSKQLNEQEKDYWFDRIHNEALSVSTSVLSAEVIDKVNIYEATRLSMKEAVENLSVKPDVLLIDAMQIDSSLPQKKIIKGDAKSISIAAASIIAKVTRDRLMTQYDEVYPGYGFAQNAGYGTKQHLEGLDKHGPSPIHRRSFKPVSNFFN